MTSFPILMEPVLSSGLSIDKDAYKKDCPGSCLRGCTSQALSLGAVFLYGLSVDRRSIL